MSNDHKIDAYLNDSIACIKIEIRLGVQGPIVFASRTNLLNDPLLPDGIRDSINTAGDVGLKAIVEYFKSSSDTVELEVLNDSGVVIEDDFFDPKKTITIDAE